MSAVTASVRTDETLKKNRTVVSVVAIAQHGQDTSASASPPLLI
jgi:hypothetical protein